MIYNYVYLQMPYKEVVSAIYMIKNLHSRKMYIGSAINVYNRFAVHRRYLRIGKHFNKHLQSAWNKYKEESFVFGIIECVEYEKLVEREEFYIQLYKSNNCDNGYNKREKCNTNFGLKASEETRKKLRESHLGNKRSPETHQKILNSMYKKVDVYDTNDTFIASFNSYKEAAESLGIHYSSVSMCMRKIIKQSHGFKFK